MGASRAALGLCYGMLGLASLLFAAAAAPQSRKTQLLPVPAWPALNALAHLPDDGTPVDPLTENAPPSPTYDANGNEVPPQGVPLVVQMSEQIPRPALIQEAAKQFTASPHGLSDVEAESGTISSSESGGGGGVPSFSRFTSFLQSGSSEKAKTGAEEEACSCTLGGYCYKKGSCVAIAMGWVAVLLIVLLLFAWALQFVIAIPTEWVVVRKAKGMTGPRQVEEDGTQVEGSSAYNSNHLLAVGEEHYR